jgi:hypothetical protein
VDFTHNRVAQVGSPGRRQASDPATQSKW